MSDPSAGVYRKCPKCRNEIAADSELCPVCGCSVRGAAIARVLKWFLVAAIAVSVWWMHRK